MSCKSRGFALPSSTAVCWAARNSRRSEGTAPDRNETAAASALVHLRPSVDVLPCDAQWL
jgi:hypothetical protein